jgi:2'-5' RNA ligase
MYNKFVTTTEQHRQGRQKHVRSQKFVTTPQQHKVRRAYYNLRQGFPQQKKSGVIPEWWQERLAKDPYLYHRTSGDSAQNILKQGLYPYDAQENPIGSQYEDDQEFLPRPGHVYLADKSKIDDIDVPRADVRKTLRVDLRKLDPEKFFADEDAYALFDSYSGADPKRWLAPESPKFSNMANKVIPSAYANVLRRNRDFTDRYYDNQEQVRDEIQQHLNEQQVPQWNSFGEWAADTLNHPVHTQYSLDHNRTIAYNGHIPPHAIETELPGASDKWLNPYSGQPNPESDWHQQTQELLADPEGENEANPWEKAAAVDPNWLSEYINRNGPYLYHGTKTPEAQQAIMKEGLYPHDKPKPEQEGQFWDGLPLEPGEIREYPEGFEPSRSTWAGQYLEPRAGHVYMGTAARASGYAPATGGGMVAIDMRKLDPSKMNADEDSFNEDSFAGNHSSIAYEQADPNHPINKVWEDNPPPDEEDDDETLGAWADRIGLGNHNVEETHHSLTNHGSIAYHGVVPPEAILPGNTYAEVKDHNKLPYNWQPDEWDMQQPHMQHAAAGDPKEPNTTLMYHVSPSVNRESIAQYGLDPSRRTIDPSIGTPTPAWYQDPRIYLSTQPAGHPSSGYDVYQVQVHGHPVERGDDVGWDTGEEWMTRHPIPSDRIQRIAKGQSSRVAASSNELHIGLDIPRAVGTEIHRWVKDQNWPEGTELEQSSEYHITVMYSPEGHDRKESWWIQHLKHAQIKITGIDTFPSGERGGLNAIVLRVESPELTEHAEELQATAEHMGLPVSKFDGGYKPHITIAYSPSRAPESLETPSLTFDVGPSEVSPPRYKEVPPSGLDTGRTSAVDSYSAFFKPTEDLHDIVAKKGMAADPYWLDNWIERNGPYLYHNTDTKNPIPPEAVSLPGQRMTALYEPDAAQMLDGLTMKNVAHNLHYEWSKGRANPAFMRSYVSRLLKMLGYPDDDITATAAIQAWQQMYPGDKVIDPMDKPLQFQVQPQEIVANSEISRIPQANYVKDWDNDDRDSTEPTPVNNPDDNWGEWGTDTDGEKPHPGIVVGE